MILCVQLHIPHQVKSYSSVKANCGSSYTCFSVFRASGEGSYRVKYPESWVQIRRKCFKVFNSTFQVKYVLTLFVL